MNSISTVALKDAYKTVDRIIEEVVMDEQSALENICIRLKQENTKVNSPVIMQIIDILGDWGKVAASDIKDRILRI